MSRFATFVKWLVTPKRKADFLIGPNPHDPYMRRWYLIRRNNKFNIYLHQMLHDDDDQAPHDHPWWSLSLCLSGVIKEYETPAEPNFLGSKLRINIIKKGMWKWRGKEYIHRLVLPEGEAWTLFITGPKARVWGFHCPKGFVVWHKFLDSRAKTGRGCGEME